MKFINSVLLILAALTIYTSNASAENHSLEKIGCGNPSRTLRVCLYLSPMGNYYISRSVNSDAVTFDLKVESRNITPKGLLGASTIEYVAYTVDIEALSEHISYSLRVTTAVIPNPKSSSAVLINADGDASSAFEIRHE